MPTPKQEKFCQCIVRGINQDYLDVVYGVNRGLNGLFGGGLDYFGNRMGFDSKMNDYLNLLSPEERQKREKLGSLAEIGGNAFKRETGTERNFGLNKIIYKHKTPREEVINLPKYIKNKPNEVSPIGQDVYQVITKNGEFKIIASSIDEQKTISTMYSPKK